jgi:tetratricopeptide (TPR) repeat protein
VGKILSLLLLFASAPAGLALDASERNFIWNEANALMAAAKVPEDYRHAAQTYQKLVDAGARNGPLFFNLGTALLQAGQYDAALDALARAERYLGAQPDIRRNMSIALARKQKTHGVNWPWYRLLLFWHFNLKGAVRLAVAVISFALFWLALTLPHLGLRRGMQTLAILTGLVCIAFGSSATTTAYQEMTAKRYLLNAPLVQTVAPRP